ncbi:Copia protein [Cyphomyrmex costatus]|uniref:Copia protein n=1 Tax=Cyphomyrmex costatus TaxID=456900 RepID=A0A151IAM5_9HYME|nr:Copia protein [Cyphomyrmex costatus]
MIMAKILTTLPKEYMYFISTWESTETDKKTLENMIAKLLGEEQRIHPKVMEEAVAFKAMQKKCFKCNKTGHFAKNCRMKTDIKDKKQIRCFKCNKVGHIARLRRDGDSDSVKDEKKCNICKKNNHEEKDCYFRDKKQNKNEDKKVALLTSEMIEENSWIVDSGSTSNMTNIKSYFKELKKSNTTISIAKTEESMKAYREGSIEFDSCSLREVLYVPKLSTNLLSVNSITKNGGEVIFTKENVIMKADNKIVLKGNRTSNGLFQVKLIPESSNKSYLSEKKSQKEAEIWHRKFGHVSIGKMKKMITMCEGVKLSSKELEVLKTVCEVCQRAKQTRLKFGDARTRAKRPLEIIHTDLCGPIDPITWNGKKYFLTFQNDYTHYTLVYLLENKYEVQDYLKE